jgi:putative ABC transport system permease protein
MLLNEILRMAFSSLGVNKMRSVLTMAGITIGVFSVIGVMTTVSALRGSIARRNITLAQAQRYQQLMEGVTDVVCLKAPYRGDAPLQATYLNRKTEPGLSLIGTNEHFLAANQFTIDIGRNFNAEDVDLARPFTVIGANLVKKLFPSESPLGKLIKLGGRTYTVVGTRPSPPCASCAA